MYVNNKKGITLIELLATLTISSIIVGLVFSVLFQSFRNMEITDRYANLRQEANIIISSIANAQLNPICTSDINNNLICEFLLEYNRINEDEWILTIGDHTIQSSDYEILLKITILNATGNIPVIDSINTSNVVSSYINSKWELHVEELRLIDKNNPNQIYEISTILNRL